MALMAFEFVLHAAGDLETAGFRIEGRNEVLKSFRLDDEELLEIHVA